MENAKKILSPLREQTNRVEGTKEEKTDRMLCSFDTDRNTIELRSSH